jgi:hypothetical protein
MVGRRRYESDRPAGMADIPTEEVPAPVVDRAKAALQRKVDGELAVLVFDSTLDDPAHRGPRVLNFEHPAVRVQLLVSITPGGCTIEGTAVPEPLRAELEPEGGELAIAETVTGGRFVFQAIPLGLVRVRLVGSPGSQPVHTDWVRV